MTPQRLLRLEGLLGGVAGSIRIAPASRCIITASSDSPYTGCRAAICSTGMFHPIRHFRGGLLQCFRSFYHPWVTLLVPNKWIFCSLILAIADRLHRLE